MVRTYGWSRCFTRPPGTSTCNRSHGSTRSKPVVPVLCRDDDSTAHATFIEVSENGRLMPDIATESLALRADPTRVGASRATGPAETDRRSDRRAGPPARQARDAGEGPAPAAAEAEALHDVRLVLVSIAAYALIWGWPFAVGFVAAAASARARARDPAAPRGGQGLGADVHPLPRRGDRRQVDGRRRRRRGAGRARRPGAGHDRYARAARDLAATGSDFWQALAYIGFFLNLFNLLRCFRSTADARWPRSRPWIWLVGLAALVALAFFFPNPILILSCCSAAWRAGGAGSPEHAEGRAYHAIPTRTRVLVAAIYLGLAALLAVGVAETFLSRGITSG